MRRPSTAPLLALFAGALLVCACGGGGGSAADTGAAAPAPTPGPAPAPTPAPEPAPNGTVNHSSTFDNAEYPLSEGGLLGHANNSWTYLRSSNGVVFPTNGTTNMYDDSYAYLRHGFKADGTQAAFGPVQTVEVVVSRTSDVNCSVTHEVEIWLHLTDDSNNLRGYELDFPCNGTLQLGRWDGPFGDSSAIKNVPTTQVNAFSRAIITGDVLKGDITANGVITMYVNGVPILRGTDTTYPTGAPGIGGFLRPGATGVFGLTSVKAWSN